MSTCRYPAFTTWVTGGGLPIIRFVRVRLFQLEGNSDSNSMCPVYQKHSELKPSRENNVENAVLSSVTVSSQEMGLILQDPDNSTTRRMVAKPLGMDVYVAVFPKLLAQKEFFP